MHAPRRYINNKVIAILLTVVALLVWLLFTPRGQVSGDMIYNDFFKSINEDLARVRSIHSRIAKPPLSFTFSSPPQAPTNSFADCYCPQS